MNNQTLTEFYVNISILHYENFVVLSPTLTTVIDVTMWITFGLSSVVFVLLIFLVVKKSPKEMRVYKWYICCNTIAIYMFELFVNVFVHPLFLSPIPTVILSPLHIFDFELYEVNLFHIILGFFIIWYYTLALMFLYRYAQTTRSQKLSRFLRNLWSILVHIVALSILISLLILYGCNVFLQKRDNFIEAMTKFTMDYKNSTTEELYEKLYAHAKTYKFEYLPLSTIIIFNVVNFIGSVLIIFSMYKIWSLLHKYRPNFSQNTFRLYKIFTFALIIEVVDASLLVIWPIAVMLICMYLFPYYSSMIPGILFTVTGFFPLVSQICMIAYITPYRRAMMRFCVKLGKYIRRQNHVNATTNRVSTIKI